MSNLSIVLNEQQVLQCILSKAELVLEVESSELFVSELGRDLFDTLRVLCENSAELIDANIVSEGNKRNPLIVPTLLQNLRKVEFSLEDFPHYLKRLKGDHAKHVIENKLLKDTLVSTTTKGDIDLEKIQDLVSCIEGELERLTDTDQLIMTPTYMMEKYKTVMAKRARGEYNWSTGDSFLDGKLADGFAPSHITTIFAATGTGKSAFALNLINKQINKRIPCFYLSLEMDLISTLDRLMAHRRKIPAASLKPDASGELPDNIMDALAQEYASFSKINHFLFVEYPGITMSDLDRLIKEAQRRMRLNGSMGPTDDYMICTVDLLTMLKGFGEDAQAMEQSMNHLNEIIKKRKIHLVGIVQANRKADDFTPESIEDLDKLRPSINNIKNSAAIAERSRLVLGLFRPKYYAERFFPDSEEVEAMDDLLQVQVLKQNQGSLSLSRYLYTPENFSFYPYKEPVRERPEPGSQTATT